MKKESGRVACGVLVLTAVFAFLALWRLDDSYLWQDEAETAVLAYNTLTHGIPVVDDGTNVLLDGGHEYNDDGVWTWQPWLQYYIGAGSFAILGKTTLAARLPFALIGIACIPLTALLGAYLFGRPAVGRLGAFFLSVSVPFILFTRQCRNYTLAVFFTLLVVYAYARFLRRERRASLLLAIALVLLYYSHILMFGGVVVGLALHCLARTVLDLRKGHGAWLLLRITPPIVAAFLLTIPWFLFSGGFERAGQFDINYFPPNAIRLVVWTNNYLFPATLLIVPAIAWAWRRLRGGAKPAFPPGLNPYTLLIGLPVGSILMWQFLTLFFMRYLVIFIPFAAILMAVYILMMWDRRPILIRAVAVVVTVALVTTNALNVLPIHYGADWAIWRIKKYTKNVEMSLSHQYQHAQSTIYRRRQLELPYPTDKHPVSMLTLYLAEIAHNYRGPVRTISEYLKENAQDGDKVWIRYGDLPLLFYNDNLRIVSWYKAALEVDSYKGARWIIPRHSDEYRDKYATMYYARIHGKPELAGKAIYTKPFQQALAGRYKTIPFEIGDPIWENRPTPDVHLFSSPVVIRREGRPPVWVEIYERVLFEDNPK